MELRKQRVLKAQQEQQFEECKNFTDVPLELKMVRSQPSESRFADTKSQQVL